MKPNALNHDLQLALVCIPIFLCAGCQSFRWGERSIQDLEELTATKETESRYWPEFKPERSLQDPAWTP